MKNNYNPHRKTPTQENGIVRVVTRGGWRAGQGRGGGGTIHSQTRVPKIAPIKRRHGLFLAADVIFRNLTLSEGGMVDLLEPGFIINQLDDALFLAGVPTLVGSQKETKGEDDKGFVILSE